MAHDSYSVVPFWERDDALAASVQCTPCPFGDSTDTYRPSVVTKCLTCVKCAWRRNSAASLRTNFTHFMRTFQQKDSEPATLVHDRANSQRRSAPPPRGEPNRRQSWWGCDSAWPRLPIF